MVFAQIHSEWLGDWIPSHWLISCRNSPHLESNMNYFFKYLSDKVRTISPALMITLLADSLGKVIADPTSWKRHTHEMQVNLGNLFKKLLYSPVWIAAKYQGCRTHRKKKRCCFEENVSSVVPHWRLGRHLSGRPRCHIGNTDMVTYCRKCG